MSENTIGGPRANAGIPPAPLQPRLIVVSGPLAGRKFPFRLDVTTLGRAPESNIPIDDDRLSRSHARIERRSGEQYWIVDCQSRNGTYVNGDVIEEKLLRFGDTLKIGGTEFLFTHQNPAEEQIMRKERLEIMGRLGAGIAHDFNNLLAAAMASINFLNELPPDARATPEGQGCIDDVLAALDQAAGLSRRLLNISRQHGFMLEPLDLKKLCDEVFQLLRRTMPRSIDIRVEAAPGLEVMGDRGQLHQMLMNLCLNACDAMPNGGTLTIAGTHANQGGNAARAIILTISDTGMGIDDDTRARIFDPFFTTKTGNKDKDSGTGLGLATVLEVTKCHGARIDVSSVVSKGTTFTITIPSIASPETNLKGTERDFDARVPGRVVPRERRLVLVIDDNELVRRSLGRLLKREGHTVVTAPSGDEGISLYQSYRPDVVLLDQDMPGKSGEDVFRQLRKLDEAARIVIMSGHAASMLQKTINWGSKPPRFIQKPFDVTAVKAALEAEKKT